MKIFTGCLVAVVAVAIVGAPFLVSAAQGGPCQKGTITTITAFANCLITVFNLLLPLFVGLAIVIVSGGILKYVAKGSSQEARQEGRKFILWGMVSIFLLLSIWGLINILVTTFPLTNIIQEEQIPKLPRPGVR